MVQKTFHAEWMHQIGKCENVEGTFSRLDAYEYFQQLKGHFISYLVYPSVFLKNPNFSLKIGCIPPVMDSALYGDVLYDTEYKVSLVLIKYEYLW